MDTYDKSDMPLIPPEVMELYQIGISLTAERDTMRLLEMIINSSMHLTNADAGTIYLLVDKETDKLSAIASNGSLSEEELDQKLLRFSIAKNISIQSNFEVFTSAINRESIVGNTVLTGKAINVADAYGIPEEAPYRHNKSFDMHTGYRTKSMLSVPMKNREGNVTGVIQLINKKKSGNLILDYRNLEVVNEILPFGHTDEILINSLSGQAAVVLDNSILYRDMQELLQEYKSQNIQLSVLSTKLLKAHEEERKRIGREIHDGPAQMASSLALKVEILKRLLEHNQIDKLAGELDKMGTDIRSTVKEIRTIIYDLKPSFLEEGLFKALESHLSMFGENNGIHTVYKTRGDDSALEYYLTSTLYRVVQEALSNAKKHGKAKNVEVNIDVDKRRVLLAIQDDGTGFDVAAQQAVKQHRLEGGFGLEGIMERIELVRGKVKLESEPGQGTRLEFEIPLEGKKVEENT